MGCLSDNPSPIASHYLGNLKRTFDEIGYTIKKQFFRETRAARFFT